MWLLYPLRNIYEVYLHTIENVTTTVNIYIYPDYNIPLTPLQNWQILRCSRIHGIVIYTSFYDEDGFYSRNMLMITYT